MQYKESYQLSEVRNKMPAMREAATKAPVLLTDNGYPAYIFMSLAQYEKLTRKEK